VEEEKFSEADLSRKRIKELKEEQAKVKVELTKQQHEILVFVIPFIIKGNERRGYVSRIN
jgi:hypothetical protein